MAMFVRSGVLNTLLSKRHEYVYKSTEPSGCDSTTVLRRGIQIRRATPIHRHTTEPFSRARFCEMLLSPEQHKEELKGGKDMCSACERVKCRCIHSNSLTVCFFFTTDRGLDVTRCSPGSLLKGARGRVRRIRMYFRSEASGALLQLVSRGRREFGRGGLEGAEGV